MTRVLLALATALVAVPATAAAQTIALESHAGARPDGAGDLIDPVIKALAGKKVTGGTALEGRISDSLSRPGSSVRAEHMATAARLVDQAEALAGKKMHPQIVRILPAAVDVYRNSAAAIAGDEDARGKAFRARVLLGEAQLAVGNEARARELATELARSFPDRAVEGPLAAFGAQAAAALTKGGTGTLELRATAPGAELYVDERKVGTGKARVDLAPGSYRVIARVGGRAGRLYRARVEAGKTARVTVHSAIDDVLRTEGGQVGMVFASESERTARERSTAVAIAKILRARRVVVIGLREIDGARALIASAFDTSTGKLLLAATIAVEPLATLEQRAHALADYLAGGAPSEGVRPLGQVEGSGKTALPPAPARQTKSRAHIYLWTGAGLGAAILAGGVYFVLIDGDGTCTPQLGQTQCPRVHDTGRLGIGMIAGGAVLSGAASYLAIRASKRSSKERRGIGLAPTRGGLAVSISGRF